MSWTDHEAATLEKLWPDGTISVAEICKRMGRGKNEVVGKAYRMHLPRRRPSTKSKQAEGAYYPRRPDYRAPVKLPPLPASVSPHTCQWIEGDPAGEHSYCGDPVQLDREGRRLPYCRGHAAKAYTNFDFVIGRSQ